MRPQHSRIWRPIAALLLLTTCAPAVTPPQVSVERAPLLISEVRPGAAAFIELYNTTTIPLDLDGYRLFYSQATQPGSELLYVWRESTLIPPHSHYLLGMTGQEESLPILADAVFSHTLDGAGGRLWLEASGQIVDAVEWSAATLAPAGRASLERRPGGDEGNGLDSAAGEGYTPADFFINPAPNPQNTGSPPTPAEAERFSLVLSAPASVAPGAAFNYELYVTNRTTATVSDGEIVFPLPPGLTVLDVAGGGVVEQERQALIARWRPAPLAAGQAFSARLRVAAPQTYAVVTARGYYVRTRDRMVMGGPVRTRIEGGVLPIAAARALRGEQVGVEGIVTYAAPGEHGGMEFYLQDESGGIQARLWGESPAVAVGDVARFSGEVRAYHGSARLLLSGITVLGRGDARRAPPPTPWTVAPPPDPAAVGRLVAVSGQAIRVEGFSYGWEIDLLDGDTGHVTLVYLAGAASLETGQVQVGHFYTVVGIGETYHGVFYVKPRTAADIAETFPPVLMIEGHAPAVVLPGEVYRYTFTVFNHTATPMSGVVITAALPLERVAVLSLADDGVWEGKIARWVVTELPPYASQSVHISVAALTTGTLTLERYAVQAAEWPWAETGPPLISYAGENVPIPIIQGGGFTSPYVGEFVTSEGIVSGIFPDLGGLWIQNIAPDDNPFTSEGLFVDLNGYPAGAEVGDLLAVRGQVQERAGQTELRVSDADGLRVIQKRNRRLPLPTPVELDPPGENMSPAAYYEPLEGMLVHITEAVAVAPTSARGECALVNARHGVGRIWHGAGEQAGRVIRVTACGQVYTGDEVDKVHGPLAADWNGYKVVPLDPPAITPGPRPAPRPAMPLASNAVRIAALHITGAPGRSDLIARIAQMIAALDAPTVVGFQGLDQADVLEEVAAHPTLARYGYRTASLPSLDCHAGGVGLLARSDRTAIVHAESYPSEAFDCPPLFVTLTAPPGAELHVVISHFAAEYPSKRLVAPARAAAAEWLAQRVDDLLSTDAQAHVIVLTGWDRYEEIAPLLTAGNIPGGRLVDVTEALPLDQWYSTVTEDGVSTLPDRILVTPALVGQLLSVEALRINADYPPTAPGRCSDHDPLAATFSWGD